MLTNPSTLVCFGRPRRHPKIVHDAAACLYDGANLKAILGKVPQSTWFPTSSHELHKYLFHPARGGGPGAGPVGVAQGLLPFKPISAVLNENGFYGWQPRPTCRSRSGRLSANLGNAGVLSAPMSTRACWRHGHARVAEYATLNANYLMEKLREADSTGQPRRASHEFIVTLKKLKTHRRHHRWISPAPARLRYHARPPTSRCWCRMPACEPTETESAKRWTASPSHEAIKHRPNHGRSGEGAPLQPAGRRLTT